jgi:ssDNA-binding Zn-finger/Zn-ribbon topoisomerase 1
VTTQTVLLVCIASQESVQREEYKKVLFWLICDGFPECQESPCDQNQWIKPEANLIA